MKNDAKFHAKFYEIFFLQNPQNWKKGICRFLPISLDSDKVQKPTAPQLKAENLIFTVNFMHFLQKNNHESYYGPKSLCHFLRYSL